MPLDIERLENVRRFGEIVRAACPACREQGRDRTGEHLIVYSDGKFGCAVCPADDEHRRRIFALTGLRADRATTAPAWPKASRPVPIAPPPLPSGMPDDVRAHWDEGRATLAGDSAMCRRVDEWRGWPDGVTALLADEGLIASPMIYGARTIAFPVHAPAVDDLGGLGVRMIGFHARHKPRPGEHARWSFHPKGTPALPFVIGAGFAPSARNVIVGEGQFDAIVGAVLFGLLNGDAGFDENVIVFGTRGAAGWRPILAHWLEHVASGAVWTLIRDNDAAGDSFREFAAELARRGRKARVIRPGSDELKDLSDRFRFGPLTAEEILP